MMDQIRGRRRILDSQMFWLSFFLFLGTVLGTIFCNRLSAELKEILENYFTRLLAPSELAASDPYSLCVGVVKKRLIWILVGILIYRSSVPAELFSVSVAYLAFKSAVVICVLTMYAGTGGILLFLGLVVPHGIFYMMALVILWNRIRGRSDPDRRAVNAGMIFGLTTLGIVSEIFLNPACAGNVFQWWTHVGAGR